MKSISLEDLTPKGAEFKLKSTGKTYKLRPVNLEDELWLKETFGDALPTIMRDRKMLDVCRIVYHQLESESAEDFVAREVTFRNEDTGVEEKRTVGGYRLFFWLVKGLEEKQQLFFALAHTIGISRPLLDKLIEEELDAQKKSLIHLTSPLSSTDSPLTTDGQPNTSSPEHFAK